jgi:type IV pilus assembly protein PilN
MRISVNLATHPFIELRPFFARLRLIMAALLLVAIGLGVALHVQRTKLEAAEDQMQNLEGQTQAARLEKTRNEARMRQPANAAVLDRAHFLNALFLRKSFSWTAVMMDLENVLPTGVQVTAIEPAVTPEGDVVIRLRVAGDRDRAVLLVRNLERSRRFLQPRLSGESSQAKDNNAQSQVAANAPPAGVDFEILANYNPVPASEPYVTKTAHKETLEVPVPRRKSAKPPASSAPYPADGVVLKPYSPAGANAPQQPKAGGAR